MASSILFGSFGRKRKRSVSEASGDFHDSEISFNFFAAAAVATPTNKKPRLQLETSPDDPICQLIDEDISFRISDPVEIVKNASQIIVDDDDETDVSFLIRQPDPEPRRSPNGYILPDPLPSGLVVTDLRKGKKKSFSFIQCSFFESFSTFVYFEV